MSANVGRNDACPCRSGKKYKKCCLNKPSTSSFALPQETRVSSKPWGVPGEEHQLWVVPTKKGQKPPERLVGEPGHDTIIQLLLSRPGYPYAAEREQKFIDDVVGDSHVAITKPLKERRLEEHVEVRLQAMAQGKQVNFKGLPNDNGYLGKFVVEELQANSFHDAETRSYQALAPFLSAWALHLDIPVNIETIQVTELSTHTSSLRVRTPNFEMTFAGGLSPALSEQFSEYASLYREGMNSNSGFYRFLCFYKIIESIPLLRKRNAEAAKAAGKDVQRFSEFFPWSGRVIALLKSIYPWRTEWDTFALDRNRSARSGKKIGWVREKYLNPLRVGIAHALLDSGIVRVTLDRLENIQEVNKWLPLCRILARVLMSNQFPSEFDLTMKPLFFGQGR